MIVFLQIQSFRLTTKAKGRELPYEASPFGDLFRQAEGRNGITVPAPYLFSFGEFAVLPAPAAPTSARPAAPYLHAAYEKPPFCCQTSAVGCTSRRKPLVPGSPLLVLCRGGWPALLHTAAPGRNPVPAPEARHTHSGRIMSAPWFRAMPARALLQDNAGSPFSVRAVFTISKSACSYSSE